MFDVLIFRPSCIVFVFARIRRDVHDPCPVLREKCFYPDIADNPSAARSRKAMSIHVYNPGIEIEKNLGSGTDLQLN